MVLKSLVVAALLVAVPGGSAKSVEVDIVKSLFQNEVVFQEKHERRQLQQAGVAPILLNEHSSSNVHHRHLEDQQACDAAFLNCLSNEKCIDCFATLETEGIEWASVTGKTPCTDVIPFLTKGGHCTYLTEDDAASKVFCSTFDSCVVWDDQDGHDDDYENHESYVNCTALTECSWDGFHRSFLGDGVCHDNIHGCYNTAVCGWDGGDCCKDTCKGDFSYVECGQDGWACRDTFSEDCDPDYTSNCQHPVDPPVDPSRGDPSSVTCAPEETKYRLIMYDSFGDGWDNTKLTVAPSSGYNNSPIYTGHLEDGAQGTEFVCLSKQPTCYTVDVTGGTWGIEVSWEVKSMGEGSPAIAGGGAPMKCDFAVAGESCENTCGGKPNIHPDDDPDYKTFKDLYTCMKDKCLIQLGTCESDPVCAKCFDEDAPDYCFNVDSFNAVIGCAMCSCTDKAQTSFCTDNVPGKISPSKKPDSTSPKSCSPADTVKGSNAVIAFSKCTDFDQVGMMVSEFDNNNFGQLDAFEACSHSFNTDPNHGGHTALGCMQILANAITNPVGDKGNPNTPKEAISALASFLYHDAESFCDCSKKASADCPLCPSFMSFKTLLYESLDACQSLDEIDCDAWNEFSVPCQTNLRDQFKTIDFNKNEQCEFAKKGCGGVGPFPAFRKMDCGQEVPKPIWEFYNDFASKCLTGDNGIPPGPAPRPAPTGPTPYTPSDSTPTAPTPVIPTAPTPVIPSDNNKPYTPDGGGTNPKPYVPSDDPKPYVPSDSKSSTNDKKKKKKSHFFRNFFLLCLVGGGGYYYYKRRTDAFNFVRYRRTRNFDFEGGESEMYSSLNDSRAFEPPTLPPTPTAMMGTEMT